MLQHGINAYRDKAATATVLTATVGIPFYIGAWPCHTGKGFAGKPQLAASFAEAKQLGGYSDEWRTENGKPKWSLCQAAYAHFVLHGMSPAIFYNVYDPAKHKKSVAEAEYPVEDHTVKLPIETISGETLVVKNGEDVLVKDADYEVYYTETAFCVELLAEGAAYSASALNVSYDTADLSTITATDIEAAVEAVEMCRSVIGIVPDLLCAPGWSIVPTVAAVMAAKAPSINGIYRAKAVVDLDTSSSGAPEYSSVYSCKNDNGYISEDMIVCWPMVKNGDKVFDLSVVVCGLIAKVDRENDDCPYESPSNKEIPITGAVNAAGEEVTITSPHADVLSVTDGVVTVLNDGGWRLWGNYLGCYPGETDVSKVFICTSRVQDWLCNRFIDTYKQYIDKPLTPAIRDAIINNYNAWLESLTAGGKLYGGAIEYITENNGEGDRISGKIRLDASAASPVPMQRVDMHISYNVELLEAALDG
ncbi:MAG: phage tail protein [Oscillospiraceae bacterium]|nr:phage tail protein [Oscillospiraceae bacterium]